MENIKLGTWSGVVDKNKIWFSNAFFNAVCCYDTVNKKIEINGVFPDVEISKMDLHYDTYIVDNNIIFSPFCDNSIRLYHKNSKTFSSIPIPHEYKPPFSRSCKVDNRIYFFTEDGNLLFYDIIKMKLSRDVELSDKYKDYRNKFGNGITIGVEEDGFTLLRWESTIVGRINVKNRSMKIYHLPDYIEKFEIVKYDDEECWIFLKDSPDILRYNKNNNSYLVVRGMEKWGKEKFKVIRYNRIKKIGNSMYLSNYNSGNILRIDRDSNASYVIAESQVDYRVINKEHWGSIYTDIINMGEKIYFLPHDSDTIICYDSITKKIEQISFSISKEDCIIVDTLIKQKLKENIIYENRGYGNKLQDFINYI